MDIQDRILAIVDATPEGSVPGRTILQKLTYFSAVKTEDTELRNTFRAHYYGPYSRAIAAELSSMSALGFLRESSEHLSNGLTRFSYSLTTDGREVFADVLKSSIPLVEKIQNAVREITEHAIWKDSMDISAAAKMHFILSQTEKPMDVDSIEECAGKLGWTLDRHKIKGVTGFLASLDLVRRQTGRSSSA